MKRRILSAAAIFALFVVTIMPAAVLAADTGTVTCTVMAQLVSVTVTDGNVTYGLVALNGEKDTTSTGVNETQTAANDGTTAEDFNIKSSDASGITPWTLAGTAGANQFVHSFSTNGGSTWTVLTGNYQSMAANIAASANKTFDLKIHMPTSVTDAGGHTITVTVQAVIHV